MLEDQKMLAKRRMVGRKIEEKAPARGTATGMRAMSNGLSMILARFHDGVAGFNAATRAKGGGHEIPNALSKLADEDDSLEIRRLMSRASSPKLKLELKLFQTRGWRFS